MQRILRLFAALFLVCVVVCHGALVLGSLRQNYACDLDAFLGSAALLAIPAYPGLVPDSLFPFLNAGVLMSVSMLCLLVGTLLCGAAHARGCTWLSDMPPRPAAHL